MQHCNEVIAPETVDERPILGEGLLGDLGLCCDLNFVWRLYVLLCACGHIYIGIIPLEKLADRLQKHFSCEASNFTKTYKPHRILFGLPAANAAAEDYMHSYWLGQICGAGGCLVGGAVFTLARPSPLHKFHLKEKLRHLAGSCFKCGGSHIAENCFRAAEVIGPYKCPHCRECMYLSCQGQIFANADGKLVTAADGSEPPPELAEVICTTDARAPSLQAPVLSRRRLRGKCAPEGAWLGIKAPLWQRFAQVTLKQAKRPRNYTPGSSSLACAQRSGSESAKVVKIGGQL